MTAELTQTDRAAIRDLLELALDGARRKANATVPTTGGQRSAAQRAIGDVQTEIVSSVGRYLAEPVINNHQATLNRSAPPPARRATARHLG
jgi:hypothetical protein